MHVSVLRTSFDKLGGLRTTAALRTPKRPEPLRDILSADEVARLIEAAPTLRDRLLIGLLYGCGLKVMMTSESPRSHGDMEGQMRTAFRSLLLLPAEGCADLPRCVVRWLADDSSARRRAPRQIRATVSSEERTEHEGSSPHLRTSVTPW